MDTAQGQRSHAQGVMTRAKAVKKPVTQDPRVVMTLRRIRVANEALRQADVFSTGAARVRQAVDREREGNGDARYIALLEDLAAQCTASATQIRQNPTAFESFPRCSHDTQD